MKAGNNEQLQRLVELSHSCRATLVQSVPVRETFRGKLAWEGNVYIFAIEGNPEARRAYAWYSPIAGSEARRIVSVLHEGLIRSPVDAVRAAIVAEHKKSHSLHRASDVSVSSDV